MRTYAVFYRSFYDAIEAEDVEADYIGEAKDKFLTDAWRKATDAGYEAEINWQEESIEFTEHEEGLHDITYTAVQIWDIVEYPTSEGSMA